MNRQGRMEKENKTLGTERRENIDTLYIEKLLLLLLSLFLTNSMAYGTRRSNAAFTRALQ